MWSHHKLSFWHFFPWIFLCWGTQRSFKNRWIIQFQFLCCAMARHLPTGSHQNPGTHLFSSLIYRKGNRLTGALHPNNIGMPRNTSPTSSDGHPPRSVRPFQTLGLPFFQKKNTFKPLFWTTPCFPPGPNRLFSPPASIPRSVCRSRQSLTSDIFLNLHFYPYFPNLASSSVGRRFFFPQYHCDESFSRKNCRKICSRIFFETFSLYLFEARDQNQIKTVGTA